MSALSEMLGMGITIQLRNMFSAPASAIVASSRGLTDAVMADQQKMNTGWKLLGAGAGMMFIGTGMLAFLGAIGKASVKSSSDLEIFRLQIRLLAKDATVGDSLFTQLTQFSTTTPFTIPQVMAGARNLLAFGLSANKVLGELKLAGNWASMMGVPIDEAALVIGKINSGAISYAMRSLQRLGVSYKLIADAGGPIDPKTMRTKKGADPEKFLEAVNKVLEQKFSGSMATIMQTVPGMLTNMKDQMILMGATIGDSIKPQIKDVLRSVLSIFNPEIVLPFAHAVGDALAFVLRATLVILKPIGEVIVWFMRLAGQHPGIVKLGIGLIALTGALLNVAGASLILLGAWQIINFVLASESTIALIATLGELVIPILAVGAAAVLLYNIWQNNFGGITTIVSHFWDITKQVAMGVISLFTSMRNGVGYMSQGMSDSLQRAGLLGIVTQVFMLGYRLYQTVMGFVDAIRVTINVLSFFASMIIDFFLIPLSWAGEVVLNFARLLGFVNAASFVSSNAFRNVGFALGILVSILAAAGAGTLLYTIGVGVAQAMVLLWNAALWVGQAVMVTWTAVTRTVTIAQWALNAAMTANPIGIIIVGVAILIGVLAAMIRYHSQITAWYNNLPGWAHLMIAVFMPIIGLGIIIARNWDAIKGIFSNTATIFREVWSSVIDWVAQKFDSLLSKFSTIGSIISTFTGISLPAFGDQPLAGVQHVVGKFSENQMNSMTNKSAGFNQQIKDHEALVDKKFTALEAFTARMAAEHARPVVIKMDGKVIAKSVNKHNLGAATAGR